MKRSRSKQEREPLWQVVYKRQHNSSDDGPGFDDSDSDSSSGSEHCTVFRDQRDALVWAVCKAQEKFSELESDEAEEKARKLPSFKELRRMPVGDLRKLLEDLHRNESLVSFTVGPAEEVDEEELLAVGAGYQKSVDNALERMEKRREAERPPPSPRPSSRGLGSLAECAARLLGRTDERRGVPRKKSGIPRGKSIVCASLFADGRFRRETGPSWPR